MSGLTYGRSDGAALGLIVLGLSAILIELYGPHGAIWRSSDPERTISGQCAYAVKVDGEPLGTVLFEEPSSVDRILARLGLSLPPGAKPPRGALPCSACIGLSGDGSVTIGRISGAQLLCLGLRIDLNLADEQDLCALPGIGRTMARRIVERRIARGGYSDVSQLLEVRGMGERKLDAISRRIEASPNPQISASH